MKPKILIVEDEEQLAQAIALYLRNAGFLTEIALDGQTALEAVQKEPPDLIVLDLMLPKVDGWEVCHRIRKDSQIPIIMLTARVGEPARIQGLELGADDYLEKPFSLRELVARIQAVLRRSAKAAPRHLVNGALVVDVEKREVRYGHKQIDLTRSEFDLLVTLMQHPGRVFSRLQLLEAIQGTTADSFDRAIDSHIKNLRKKIEPDPKHPQLILTVYGVGYRFRKPPEGGQE
ncbi:MAG: response regulator transcription factor [Candidatus Bipolaricaulota bacterium]|nr:response regulator transcription factor [Candidatus Bipolaricaulota bacterium]MCS7273848.1 response regulator transcription factor [Candidatus Bipolaricaulota bacterium]MDW8110734.1 response regulator transcription factor [Candidatus Bipolaricaulota bacterium]MDW8328408.1 response regulator transcription factor [Candidatus Bipolaricaulota bacterium]